MNKRSQDQTQVNHDIMNRRARFFGGGLGIGVGSASLIALLHELSLESRRRKEEREAQRTDENTLVLTLPPKAAELLGIPNVGANTVKTRPSASTTTVPRKSVSNVIGSKTMKVADGGVGSLINMDPGAPTSPSVNENIKGNLFMGAGVLSGWALVDAIHQARVKRKLREEEEQAQQEYLGVLSGSKTAEWMQPIGDILGKQAGDSWPTEVMKSIASMGGLAWLTTAAGTAWITKRILDAKAKERDKAGYNPPLARRIIFKTLPTPETAPTGPAAAPGEPVQSATAEQEEEQKMAQDETDAVRAMFAVMVDRLDDTSRIMNTPAVQAEFKKLGMTNRDMFQLLCAPDGVKEAAERGAITSEHPAMQFLLKHAAVRDALIVGVCATHPVIGRMFKQGQYKPTPSEMDLAAYTGFRNRAPDVAKQLDSIPQVQASGAWDRVKGLFGAGGSTDERVLGEVRKRYNMQPGAISTIAGTAGHEATADFARSMLAKQQASAAPAAAVPGAAPAAAPGAGAMDMLRKVVGEKHYPAAAGYALKARYMGGKAWDAIKPYAPLLVGGAMTWLARRGRKPEEQSAANWLPLLAGLGWTGYNKRNDIRGLWRGAPVPAPGSELMGKKGGILPDTSGSLADIGTVAGVFSPDGGEPQEQASKPTRLTTAQIQDILKQIRLEAADPNAAAYLARNRRRLTAALSDLAAQGKL